MKINTLSSTHKKYIKKYGAKKAAEKYNLNLTKAKSYEKKYKSESYQGKRKISKSNKNESESIDVFEEESPEEQGISNIGSLLGYDPSVHTANGPNTQMAPGMPGMPPTGPQMPNMGLSPTPEMMAMSPGMGGMPGMPGQMPGQMPGMGGMPKLQTAEKYMGLSPTMADGSMNFDPSQMGMPMGGMPGMQMPMGGMPNMFQGANFDPSNVDPLMVEIAAPVNKFNGNMQQIQNLPSHLPNINLMGGGKPKVDLRRLAFF